MDTNLADLMQIQFQTKLLRKKAEEMMKKYKCEFDVAADEFFGDNFDVAKIWREWRSANERLTSRRDEICCMKDEVSEAIQLFSYIAVSVERSFSLNSRDLKTGIKF